MARRQEESEEEEEESGSEESTGQEESSSESGSDSGSEEEDEDDDAESEDDEEAQKAAAKHSLVEADLVEIKKMMEEMDRIKMRLQFRLAREAENAGHSPLRRRSSVEDIYVPAPTVSAAVQTAWDMSRMYDVEKIVTPTETTRTSKTIDVGHQENSVPVNKSVQLSLHDLARTYGIQESLFDNGSMPRPPSPANANPHTSTNNQPFGGSFAVAPRNLNAHMWDGLVMAGGNEDHRNQSDGSEEKPPKLNRSQLIPDSSEPDRTSSLALSFTQPDHSSLEDSFGIPNSPTKTSQPPPLDGTSSDHHDCANQPKTMEQKEMEAIKSLLFF